jgi:hypothetical protein
MIDYILNFSRVATILFVKIETIQCNIGASKCNVDYWQSSFIDESLLRKTDELVKKKDWWVNVFVFKRTTIRKVGKKMCVKLYIHNCKVLGLNFKHEWRNSNSQFYYCMCWVMPYKIHTIPLLVSFIKIQMRILISLMRRVIAKVHNTNNDIREFFSSNLSD